MPAAGASPAGSCRRARARSTRTARCGSAFAGPRRWQLVDAALAARDAIARHRARVAARRRCACTASRRGPSAPACTSRRPLAAAALRRRATARPRPSARRASPRCRDAARARASRCRRGSRRARRTRTPRSPPPSSGRCRAAWRASRASRGNAPPCSATIALRRRVQVMRAAVVAEPAPLREHAIDRRRGERAARRGTPRRSARSTGSPSRPASAAA